MKPVQFTVQAVVTSSDLQFDHTEVYFGYCSIYQTVKSSVRLTNLSLLPQEFGFVGVPEVFHQNLYKFSSVVQLIPYFVLSVTVFVECRCLDPVSKQKQCLKQDTKCILQHVHTRLACLLHCTSMIA